MCKAPRAGRIGAKQILIIIIIITIVIVDMRMTFFYSHVNKTHFHNKGFALSLVLKAKVFGSGLLEI